MTVLTYKGKLMCKKARNYYMANDMCYRITDVHTYTHDVLGTTREQAFLNRRRAFSFYTEEAMGAAM